MLLAITTWRFFVECAVCDDPVVQALELDGIISYVRVAGELRPVHGRCCDKVAMTVSVESD